VRHETFAEPGNGPDAESAASVLGRKDGNGQQTAMHPAIHIAYRIRENAPGPWVTVLRFVLTF